MSKAKKSTPKEKSTKVSDITMFRWGKKYAKEMIGQMKKNKSKK